MKEKYDEINQTEVGSSVNEKLAPFLQAKKKKRFSNRQYKEFRVEIDKDLRKILDIMPEQIKNVLLLRFFKNMPFSEIASKLNIKKGTVQSYLNRGINHIRFFLDDNIKEQEKRYKVKRMRAAQTRERKIKG